MIVKEFVFTTTLVEPYDRIQVGDAVVFDDYPDRAWVDLGVVTEIEVAPEHPDNAWITIAFGDKITVAKRLASDFNIGKMKKIRNIANFKEDK